MNVYVLIASSVAGFVGAWFMSRYAYRFGLLDIPNDRSSHRLPTPRGGGIGILAAFTVSSLVLNLPFGIWVPAAVLSLVSFFDDKLNLAPRTRLIFQFAASVTVVVYHSFSYGAVTVAALPFLSVSMLFIFYCVFVVGTANFYNFMDGINGIAGITGVVSFGLLGLFAVRYAQAPILGFSAFCISAACTGFLPLNIPRARVFMGDVGSILLGFVFASYVILLSRSVADFLLLTGFLSTFYLDALTTIFVRKRDGETLSEAHRRHLYQLFANQKQITHWKVATCYGFIQAAVGLLLIQVYTVNVSVLVMIEFSIFVVWLLVMKRVRQEVEVV